MTLLVLLAAALLGGASAQLPIVYNHGVASGDPLPEAMIIWTRITPRLAYEYDIIRGNGAANEVWVAEPPVDIPSFNVSWRVSREADMGRTYTEGVTSTNADRDYTVKIDVTGLRHSRQYYYQFECEGVKSPIGKFRTPPRDGYDNDKIRYGQFTCSSWAWGYFNAYDYASHMDLDFWLHAGDYIYEYGPNFYPNAQEAVRFAPFPGGLQPPRETITLSDYRERYALHRTDPGLQALHASSPLIAIWDDHEHADDNYKDGADNHQPDEGSYEQRTEWSVRAWHEWLPVRGGTFGEPDYKGENITRSFQYGKLAKILALEQRLQGKTQQYPDGVPTPVEALAAAVGVTPPDQWTEAQIQGILVAKNLSESIRSNPQREILGEEQLAWVEKEASSGDYRWLLVLQTTNIHDLVMDYEGAIELGKRVNPDAGEMWEEALKNVTTLGGTTLSYSTSPHQLYKYLQPQPVTPFNVLMWSAAVAAGRYDITTFFDSWGAYPAERERFMQALKPAGGNAVLHSGDTHAAYAAMLTEGDDLTYIGAEFSAAGVTSPSIEQDSVLPLELHNAAQLVSKGAWMDTRYKGFEYVVVTKEDVSVNFVNLPWGSLDYHPTCDYRFELPHSSRRSYRRTTNGYQPSKNGLPADTINELINVAGEKASRVPMGVKHCDDLPAAQPYRFGRHGVPIGVGTPLADVINRAEKVEVL